MSGHNGILLIRNFCIKDIEKNTLGFWKKVKQELEKKEHDENEKCKYFGFGDSVNGFAIVANAPVEYTNVLAVGQNYATVLGKYKTSYGHHKNEDKVKLVKKLADDLGYKLVRK